MLITFFLFFFRCQKGRWGKKEYENFLYIDFCCCCCYFFCSSKRRENKNFCQEHKKVFLFPFITFPLLLLLRLHLQLSFRSSIHLRWKEKEEAWTVSYRFSSASDLEKCALTGNGKRKCFLIEINLLNFSCKRIFSFGRHASEYKVST